MIDDRTYIFGFLKGLYGSRGQVFEGPGTWKHHYDMRLYEKVPCILLQKKRRPHTVKIFLKNFKRPKNREDRSDFDDFLTELIAMTSAIISKNFFVRRGGESPKISKSYRKIFTDHPRIGFIQTASALISMIFGKNRSR